jgi:hypothetical protein
VNARRRIVTKPHQLDEGGEITPFATAYFREEEAQDKAKIK